MYKKQLDKSEQLKAAMNLYVQDCTQRGEPKSYEKLKRMVRIHLEEATRKRHRLNFEKKRFDKGYVAPKA